MSVPIPGLPPLPHTDTSSPDNNYIFGTEIAGISAHLSRISAVQDSHTKDIEEITTLIQENRAAIHELNKFKAQLVFAATMIPILGSLVGFLFFQYLDAIQKL